VWLSAFLEDVQEGLLQGLPLGGVLDDLADLGALAVEDYDEGDLGDVELLDLFG